MAAINLNGYMIDPASQSEGGKHYVPDASTSKYILLQGTGELSVEQFQELFRLKVEFLEYLSGNTYRCRYEPTDLEPIRRLPFILYANVYHADLAIAALLKAKAFGQPGQSLAGPPHPASEASSTPPLSQEAAGPGGEQVYDVIIVLHDDTEADVASVKEKIAGLLQIDSATIGQDGHCLCIKSRARDLEPISRIDDVWYVEELRPLAWCNHRARRDLGLFEPTARFARTNRPPGIGAGTYDGEGQIVVVADSGFDVGLAGTLTQGRPDQDTMHPALRGRVIEIKRYTSRGLGLSQTEDRTGHGTHVAASIAGCAASREFGVVKGTAPKAQLVIHSIQDVNMRPAPPVGDLAAGSWTSMLIETYERNYGNRFFPKRARIHNNSYTLPWDPAAGQGHYDGRAVLTDRVIYNRKDYVMLFAAGNDGEEVVAAGTGQIGGYAGAKNVITVGACNSSHPTTLRVVGGVPADDRYEAGQPAGNINEVAYYSSRGPTDPSPRLAVGGVVPPPTPATLRIRRIKPDVVAPGTCIYSARSRFNVPPVLDAAGAVLVAGVPLQFNLDPATHAPRYDRYGVVPATDINWIYDSGTSMATPLVAGCCAILRGLLLKKNIWPNAALIKALLINNAVDLSLFPFSGRGLAITAAPDNIQGFGRVDINSSILNVTDTVHGGIVQGTAQPGGVDLAQRIVIPPGPGHNLSVSMVYTDPPGFALQSQLSLRFEAFGGFLRFADPQPAAGAAHQPDMVNNAQRIVWRNVPEGEGKAFVHIGVITPFAGAPQPQDYALVWYIWN